MLFPNIAIIKFDFSTLEKGNTILYGTFNLCRTVFER